jgi:NAD(P)-dependent dehydrogenase (short-subunit alcohol dehydrogenase family)
VKGFGIGVSIIEPGLIKTQFGETAVGSIEEATSDDGPYAKFNAAVAASTANAYDGAMSRLAAPPDAVARAVQRAITSRRPKPRYVITVGARLMLGVHSMLPARGWDAMMRSQFPQPR